MNSKSQKTESQWQPCSAGAIQSSADSIRARKSTADRRRFLKSVSGAAIVAAGVGFAGWTLLGQKDELNALRNNPNFPGGIACSEVTKLLDQYIAKTINDAALVESIDVHLAGCGHCNGIHESKTQSV